MVIRGHWGRVSGWQRRNRRAVWRLTTARAEVDFVRYLTQILMLSKVGFEEIEIPLGPPLMVIGEKIEKM